MFCVFFTEMLLWNRKSQQSEPQNQTVCFFFFSGRCLTEAEREQQKRNRKEAKFLLRPKFERQSRHPPKNSSNAGRETQTSAQTHVGSPRESDGRISAALANQESLSIPDTDRDVMAGIMQMKPISRLSEITLGGKLYDSVQQSSGRDKS